ncbi:G patch domain-containing protein 11 [Diprion similis]|uniref:G patch domain-containing protein 11 n=1 Tax=Diprion similis TaxID=362088 RepID=UPI001EF9B05E|nr:G patch domain-containing protein 11 [Diprion similis]XP_046742569.1 G patch domain-containing protein 11 [Diprion similis]XP_046742570.1 G patch domain-containing protein 11 [Diprion similis]
MSDDEDYMSDKFLLATEQHCTPILARRRADQRELDLLKRKAEIEARLKEKNVSVRVIEQETRDKGLASAITSDNKGFKLLEKMGYTPGQGIGKKESGICEPISIDLKTNRLGLGRAPKKKSLAIKNGKKKEDDFNADDFRGRISQKKTEQMIEVDLRRSQKSCEQLDNQNNIDKPMEIWYWPKVEEEEKDSENSEAVESSEEDEDENEDDQNIIPASEKLEILTKYLRDKYFYCIWCGAAYDDVDDLRDNCPGNTRDDH